MESTPVAVVTGASKGLGFAIARSLARRGWRLVIDGRDPVVLDRAAAQLRDDGALDVVAIAGDVTDPAHRAAVARAAAERAPVAVYVANASTLGATPRPSLVDYPVDALTDAFATNAVAPLALLQQLRPSLAAGGRGPAVVAVTSDAAVEPYEGWGGYGATKAALEQLWRVLAVEEPTWRVYVVDPGDLRTDMHQAAFPGEDISDRPEPVVAVPGFLDLVDGARPSGRYQAQALAEVRS